MKEKMDAIKNAAIEMIERAQTSQDLADVRVKYLGKSGEISLVISSRKDAYALERAKSAGIPAVCVDKKACGGQSEFERKYKFYG